jgi:16S rRNA G966 N2-methylase RsmD
MTQDQNAINPMLLSPEVQRWIRTTRASLDEIAFAPLPFEGLSRQELIQQVEGYRKAVDKLPRWGAQPGLLFPVKLSLEQCSSEATARYKAQVIKNNLEFHPKEIADLTGGFGVDAYALAQSGARVHHFELDESLSNLVAHNMRKLKAEVLCHHADGVKGLLELKLPVDLIYLDPARRDAQKNKVFRLEDCRPDILFHLEDLLAKSPYVLLKTSPMLDLHLGLTQLKWVREIHVVAVNNEVKEVLWLISRSAGQEDKTLPPRDLTDNKNPKVYAVNLSDEPLAEDSSAVQKNIIFDFIWNQPESNLYSTPLAYIFEPNGPLRKIGQYAALTQRFPILRIGPNAHLFTAEQWMDFPGRIFEVLDKWPFAKSEMKRFKGRKYNITTRDFPQTVAHIRATWQIKDGGQEYLFFTTDARGIKWIILCRKATQYPKI